MYPSYILDSRCLYALSSTPISLTQTHMATPGPLEGIARAIDTRDINPDTPMIIDGERLKELLPELTSDFASRLRDCTLPSYDVDEEGQVTNDTSVKNNGVLLTFHRDAVNLSAEDNLEADGIADDAGVVYSSPDSTNVLKTPRLPLPEDVIRYVQLRVANARIGVPQPSDYKLFKILEAKKALGFGHPKLGLIKPDNIVLMTAQDGKWNAPMALPYSNLSLSPNAQMMHYGSAEFEGMTAQIGVDGDVYIFGMKEHYERYRNGALKQGIEYVSQDIFSNAVIMAVQQNARFMPKDGRMYIRQHTADVGPQMKVGNSRVSGFYIEVTPIGSVGSYFGARKIDAEGNVSMKVMGVPDNKVRSTEGQGLVKGVGNYAHTPAVIMAVSRMNVAEDGKTPLNPDGLLYLSKMVEGLDPKSEEFRSARICETNASNTIFIKNLPDGRYRLVVPTLDHGDILPGNTRMLILAKAVEMGWEIDIRDVTIGELMEEDPEKRFCDSAINCGTAAMISPFDAIHLLHVKERTLEEEKAGSDTPKLVAEPRGTLINIRSQEAVNAEPTPKPVEILLKQLLAVKAGASGENDKKNYLTRVPGLKAREMKEAA